MPEAVRRVVWDLDDTFWKGTFSEGGVTYSRQNHDVVIELNRRGIMNAICSKNDREPIRDFLQGTGAGDNFIFPSISWKTKGPRLRCLIEEVQVCLASVMFIDDNHLNRAEAAAMIPELQIDYETFIPALLDDPLFVGKKDESLSSLRQYKVLEAKRTAQLKTGGDNAAFLRASAIRVFVDYDVAANIDRAIELINRTNHLNFTKNRLPEEPQAARAELLTELSAPKTVDWITQVFSTDTQSPRDTPVAPSMVMFGGCELQMISAFLKPYTDEMTVIGNYAVKGMFNRVNSVANALDFCDRRPENFTAEAAVLGLPLHAEARDFIGASAPGTAFVFHSALDAHLMPRARHRT